MAASKFSTTLYLSSNFVESAGMILFKLSTRQVCLIHYTKRNEWLLAKGRRDIGESREKAAVRETEEETGFKCRLLPIAMTTKQPRPGYDDFDGGRQEGICEPFVVMQRVLKDGSMKMIWWYIGAIDESADVGKGEAEFKSRLFGFEEALEVLTFQSDREVVMKAIEVFRGTFGEED